MAHLRKANGQFKKGHGKVHKKHHSTRHHKRRNPAGAASVVRVLRAAGSRGGLARAGRILVVR